MSSKRGYLKLLPYQSGFSHYCASWANNHMGWAKMKKLNRRVTKGKMRTEMRKEMEDGQA